jgi:hypothetical protein
MGPDVGQRITNPDDRQLFSISPNATGQPSTPLGPGSVVTIQPCQSLNFCVTFNPTIPGTAGRTSGLAATDVLPDTVTSRIRFIQAGGADVFVNLLGHVAPDVLFINANNPRKTPRPSFIRSGDEFTITYALFDPSLDISRARYEFLNQSGGVVGDPIDVDLAQPIQQQDLTTGQSLSVEQRFTGAAGRPDIVAVRLTIFDEQSNTTITIQLSSSAASALTVESRSAFDGARLSLPILRLLERD